mgnify:CR=1 FL=1
MKNNLIIKKCMSCGAIVKVLKDCTCNNCGIKCCGEEMQILLPNSVDAAIENSYSKALKAFTMNKTIKDAFQAKKILDEMIEANKDYWPELKK